MFFLSLTEDTAIFLFHGIELNRKTYHLGPINTLLVPGSLVEQKPIRKIFWIPGFERRSCPIFQSHPILSKGVQQPLLNLLGCIPGWSVVVVFFSDNQNGVSWRWWHAIHGRPKFPRGLPCESGNVTQVQLYDVTKSVAITQEKIGSQGWGWVETWIKRPYYL